MTIPTKDLPVVLVDHQKWLRKEDGGKRADLSRANLSGASLSGADLSHANLSDAKLSGADLSGTAFHETIWRDDVKISKAPIEISGLFYRVFVLEKHMQIGCELHSLADWKAFKDRRIVKMDGKDALKFWRENKAKLLAFAK